MPVFLAKVVDVVPLNRQWFFWCYCFHRTNIPKEVMSFPDFPFEKRLPSFVHHTEVRKYLEQYCDQFRVRDHIKVEAGRAGAGWACYMSSNVQVFWYSQVVVSNEHGHLICYDTASLIRILCCVISAHFFTLSEKCISWMFCLGCFQCVLCILISWGCSLSLLRSLAPWWIWWSLFRWRMVGMDWPGTSPLVTAWIRARVSLSALMLSWYAMG